MIGRLYRIEGGGKFYIGSTTQELKKRLKNHRSKSNEQHRKTTPLYEHFNRIGWKNATITLLSEIEVENRDELLKKEDDLVRENLSDENCLNKMCVVVTSDQKKEYDKIYGAIRRSKNKESERERVKQWRIANPEKWREQTARYRQRKAEQTNAVNN